MTPIMYRGGPSSLARIGVHLTWCGLAVPLELDLDRAAVAVLRDLLEFDLGVHRLAVHGDQHVALLQPGLFGRVAGLDLPELDLPALVPSRKADADPVVQHGRHGRVEALAVALDR